MLLILIASAAFLSTLLGGLCALALRDKLHLILGFSAGAVIGVAFFDLLPEALAAHAPLVAQTPLAAHSSLAAAAPLAAHAVLAWAAVGFLAYLVLDRLLAPQGSAAARGGVAAAVLCLHSLIDGIAVGFAFEVSRSVGLVVTIGVLTHDFSDGINTMNVVLAKNDDRRRALTWLALDALAPAVGIGITRLLAWPAGSLGVVLAVFGGCFLYLGASDLIPESYHAHPKFFTTAMTLAGAGVLYAAVVLLG